MHEEVKQYADSGDVKNLKYIFVDCLDVDPTFEKYREDYEYCKRGGLFESHKDLTALSDNKADWDENYWQKLKNDLLKNFSGERLEHMVKVAKVVNAEKYARLQRERQNITAPPPRPAVREVPPQVEQSTIIGKSRAQQEEELAAARRKLAAENAAVEESERRQREQIQNSRRNSGESAPKKDSGAAWKIIAGIILILIIIAIIK